MYKETLQTILEAEGLNANTTLYRYTNAHHLKKDDNGDDFIEANPDSPEMVVDHYANGHLTSASDMGAGLAFALSKDSRFKTSERKCVSVKLGDILEQGGVVYKDESSGEPNSWYLTMPNGRVKITIE